MQCLTPHKIRPCLVAGPGEDVGVARQCPGPPICCHQQQVLEAKPTVLDVCPASAASTSPPKPSQAEDTSLLLSRVWWEQGEKEQAHDY